MKSFGNATSISMTGEGIPNSMLGKCYDFQLAGMNSTTTTYLLQ